MNSDKTIRTKPLQIRLGRAGLKNLRLDRPLDPDQPDEKAATAQSAGLIQLILNAIRSSPADRRAGVRHPAVKHEIWVGWFSGDNFAAVKGSMRNISRGGALVVLGHRPPTRGSVWIYKEEITTLASVRAEVIASTPAPGGLFAVRFRFPSPCPTTLCESVACERST